jgi:F-type H+-transporting ATPase subunit gamma
MASIRDLRGRMRSVGSIHQITRAMEMVARTKLRRFQMRAVASRPYSQEITALVAHMVEVLGSELGARPLFQRGAGAKTLVLVVTSDRGLCGSYNSNLLKKLEHWRAGNPEREIDYYVYGRKGYQYLTRRGRKIEHLLVEPILEKIDYRGAARSARLIVDAFLTGEYSDVIVFYTAFESMVSYVPTMIQFLPIEASALAPRAKDASAMDPDAIETEPARGDVILEPDAQTIFERIIPRYLETRMFNLLLESLTSEYASRRVSMKNATDAAKSLGHALRKLYNRKRQENITKELLDIVGGSEALR